METPAKERVYFLFATFGTLDERGLEIAIPGAEDRRALEQPQDGGEIADVIAVAVVLAPGRSDVGAAAETGGQLAFQADLQDALEVPAERNWLSTR